MMKIRWIRKPVRRALVMLAGGLLWAGCQQQEKQNSTHATDLPAQAVPAHEAMAPTDTRADILFKDTNGKTLSLRSLTGKVVFINFWATWCPPCIQEMPSIHQLKQSFNDTADVVFLMVDVDNNIEKSSAFMKKKKYDLPVYVPASDIPPDYLGGAIPTTVILDKKGEVVARMEGGRDYARPEVQKALRDLVEEDYGF
ncbi:TlpA family protein disulfide reductase [Sphingobacterium suaedae]|uniref:TlpA family protein disulfide reductase n=1 Tax=Sphingobacterium suaedae TaxID=1686402 RepID=A0ABW5KLV4_9SPHI